MDMPALVDFYSLALLFGANRRLESTAHNEKAVRETSLDYAIPHIPRELGGQLWTTRTDKAKIKGRIPRCNLVLATITKGSTVGKVLLTMSHASIHVMKKRRGFSFSCNLPRNNLLHCKLQGREVTAIRLSFFPNGFPVCSSSIVFVWTMNQATRSYESCYMTHYGRDRTLGGGGGGGCKLSCKPMHAGKYQSLERTMECSPVGGILGYRGFERAQLTTNSTADQLTSRPLLVTSAANGLA